MQQLADSGPSLIFLVAFSLIIAGFSVYIVSFTLVACLVNSEIVGFIIMRIFSFKKIFEMQVNERMNGEKHQQKLSGVSGFLYWTVAFIWDFTIYCLCVALCGLVFELMNAPIYIVLDNMLGALLLLVAFGFAMIPCVYVIEKLFSEPSLAKMAVFCINVVLALTTTGVILLLDVLAETDNDEKFKDYLNRIFLIFPQHALSNGLFELCKNHILASVFARFNINTYKKPIGSDLLLVHFSSLFILGIAFFIINLILEYRGSINRSIENLSSQGKQVCKF